MSDNSRLAKNTVLLYLRMLAVMAISLYTSRIILQNLGILNFGLYSVVGGVATTFTFLNSAMNSSTQRYLTIAIGKGDGQELHKIFNVSLIIHLFIGLLIIGLCEVLGVWFIKYQMSIPYGRESAVMWSFQFSLLAVFFTIVTVPYNALIISRERMGAFAYLSIFDVCFKLFIAYIISVFHYDRLIFYSLLMVLSQIVVQLSYVIYCRYNFEETKILYYRFCRLYTEMASFASWGLLGHLSVIVNTSIQDMMLNVFFTPVVNAARGIAVRVSSAIYAFNDNFQTAVSPQITKAYAVNNKERMFALIYNSSRFSLLLVWLLSLPILLCLEEILELWLKEVPENTALFLKFVLFDNIIRCLANPLNMAIRANGNIRWPEICGGIILILNLPLSFMFLKMGYQAYIVFIIMIVCDLICHGVRLYFANEYIKLSVRTYLTKVIINPSFIIFLSSLLPYFVSCNIYIENTLLYISSISILSLFSILISSYFFGITPSERIYINNFVKKKMKDDN